jgi:hypothetical protein
LKVAPFTLATCTKVKRGNTNHKKGENTISNTTSKNKEEIIWHLVKSTKSTHELIASNVSKTKRRTT